MRLDEFLLARIAEDEAVARDVDLDARARILDEVTSQEYETWRFLLEQSPARVLAECEAKRRIVEWHRSWPVLVQTEPAFERTDGTDLASLSFSMSQRIAWLTQEEYRARFGDEPPSAPILVMLAQPYADHPDFDPEWRLA